MKFKLNWKKLNWNELEIKFKLDLKIRFVENLNKIKVLLKYFILKFIKLMF